ncbi:MAG: SDH family Clp fold serine proteinase [Candidatus Baldrarchaeia archaeon]
MSSGVFEGLIREEDNKEIIEFGKSDDAALLAIIAPHVPYRVSPERVVSVELGDAEEFAVEAFILRAKEIGVKKLYLLIHSPGGGVSSAYIIAKALRKNFEYLRVYVPQVAASGATLIAISGNEIIMGEISRLSPIDVLMWSGDRIKSALALLRSFYKLEEKYERTPPQDIPYPSRHLIESIDPEELERMTGILREVETYAMDLLTKAGYPSDKAKSIAEKLVYGFHSHYEVIDYEKAGKLGLNVKWYEDYREDWVKIKRWLGKYILEESPIHHVVYVLPGR